MVKQPNIAVFQPHESMASAMNQTLAKNIEFTYEYLNSIDELRELLKGNSASFDVIIIPSQLHDKSSAVTSCIQIKSDEILSSIPIIVLSNIKDTAAISTFYGSGADVVITLPVDAKILSLQASSLQRLKKSMVEEEQSFERDKGLRQAIISALHFVEEALVIFDPSGNVVFSNQSAKQLLNLYDDLQSTNIQKAYNLLQSICLKAINQFETGSPPIIYHKNISLVKNTGETLRADMRITALRALDGDAVAYCLSIVDISAPSEISNTLIQSEKSQYLSLLLASACMQLLNTKSLGSPVNPLSKVEQVFSREDPTSSLETICTSLLEFIDNIASSSQAIRLEIPQAVKIAMKASHLFILLGSIAFYTMRRSFSKSDTLISFKPSDNAFYGRLTIRTKNSVGLDHSKEVAASSAFRTEFLNLSNKGSAATGIEQASKIASLYKLQISHKNDSDNEIELEIELPIAV